MPTGVLQFAQQASLPTLAVAALLLAITAFIKVMPQLRQTRLENDNALRTDLLGRITALEAEVVSLRKTLDRRAAEFSDLQHDLSNEMASLDAFIMLAESNPDKVMEQIPRIKDMRERHRQRVALKRGAREGERQGHK